MQRSLRMNELQLLALSEKALHDNGLRGYLFKRTNENSKWQLRWFIIFQNLLFYFENENGGRPSGVIFLEGELVRCCIVLVLGQIEREISAATAHTFDALQAATSRKLSRRPPGTRVLAIK